MLVDKSFQDPIIPLLILPLPLLVILPSHDLYPFHHIYLKLLLFVFAHRRLSPKHDNVNGDGNSSKKNSRKNHLKELTKIPSSSNGPASKIESMIQLPSSGVMLQLFSFHITDTRPIYLCDFSPSYLLYIALLSPSHLFHMQPFLTP